MNQRQEWEQDNQHPSVSEHPEQRRQEETGREDPIDPSEIGRPPSQEKEKHSDRAA